MTGRSLHVAVSPPSAWDRNRGLFADLEPLLPVRIAPTGQESDGDTLVMLNVDRGSVDRASGLGHPVYTRVAPSTSLRRPGSIRFTPSPRLDPRLRGQQFPMPDLPIEPVTPGRGDDVLAFAGSDPVWVERSVNGHIVDIVGIQPTPDGIERGADELIAALPLVHFLRRLVGRSTAPPPVRACFLVDDPNLRWWSYGYLRYRELAGHAAAHGYHLSISMIPLDARFTHPGVARFVKSRPAEYSVSMQGNNHTHREMARTSSEDQLASAAQALRRILRFERQTGLAVDRVVVPPHGGLSVEGLDAESMVGLDGIAASPWSIPDRAGHVANGVQPTVAGPNGLAVLIRRHINEHPAWMAMDAYLNKPVIVYFHHEDLKDGLDVLAEGAQRVNRLGNVTWCSLDAMVQSQYVLTTDGERADVCLYSPRVALELPAEVKRLTVRHASPGSVEAALVAGTGVRSVIPLGSEIEMSSGGSVSIELLRHPIVLTSIPSPRWGPWPIMRRLMTETRDRLRPLLRR